MRWILPAIAVSLALHGALLGWLGNGSDTLPGSEAQVKSTVIVFDTPPALAVSDAGILSSMVNGVVLVVRGGHTPRDFARRAADRLTRLGAKLLGVVLNGSDWGRPRYRRYSYAESSPAKRYLPPRASTEEA